jgi:hypothetical protein
MTANCALYVPVDFFPSRAQFEPFLGDGLLELSDFDEVATVTWKGLTLRLSRMPKSAVADHLQGFIGYARSRGGNDALVTRILHTRAVYGCVIEPAIDDAGRAMKVVAGITNAADGLCFLEEEVYAAGGRPLLSEAPLQPPTAERVRDRAWVLLALSVRGLLEEDAGTPDAAEAEAQRQVLFDWAESTVPHELEPEERAFLAAPVGTPNRSLVVRAVWRAEGAQVLLWALNARALPRHDAQEHPYTVAREAGVMAQVPGALQRPTLRTPAAVELLRKTLLGVHWRLRELGVNQGKVDFAGYAKRAWFGAFSLEGVPLADGDLSVDGVTLALAKSERVQLARSIAHERHLAANWLIGTHDVYSSVNTPT